MASRSFSAELLLGPLALLVSAASASAQCELANVAAPGAWDGAKFGQNLALDGGRLLVGSADEPDGGGAYLFDLETGALLATYTAPDLAVGDAFGAAVDLAGDTVIVGSVLDDDQGKDSGAAYVFDAATGVLRAKLVAPDGAPVDLFGIAVAVGGGRVLVGADGDDDGFVDSGSVYVFEEATGTLLAKLHAPDAAPADRFGGRLALDGNRALVSAWQKAVGSATSAGKVYLFDLLSGQAVHGFTASDPEGWDYFGDAIDLDGGRALVGAPRTEDLGTNSGAAYVFDIGTGAELAKLLPADGAAHDQFGEAVAISGDVAVVGAPFQDDVGGESGSLYVFDLAAGLEVAQLYAEAATDGDLFGISAVLEDGRGAVGASGDDAGGFDVGSVRVLAIGAADCDGDGVPDACRLATGAAVDLDGNGVPDECQGGPFFFQSPTSGQWLTVSPRSTWLAGELAAQDAGGHLATIHDGAEASWIRSQFAAARDLLIGYNDSGVEGSFAWIAGDPPGYEQWGAGEPNDKPHEGTGSADFVVWNGANDRWRDEKWTAEGFPLYGVDSDDCDGDGRPDVWQIATGAGTDWDGDGVLDSCESPNYCTANPNSSGFAATIGALGSPKLATNDFTLLAAQLPPHQFGYFLTSFGTDFVPFFGGGQGNLCLGAPIYRLSTPPYGAVLDSGSDGRFSLPLDLAAMPPGIVLQPGDVLFFQAWFRDVVGGVPTSNTSDGLEVRFR